MLQEYRFQNVVLTIVSWNDLCLRPFRCASFAFSLPLSLLLFSLFLVISLFLCPTSLFDSTGRCSP